MSGDTDLEILFDGEFPRRPDGSAAGFVFEKPETIGMFAVVFTGPDTVRIRAYAPAPQPEEGGK